MKNVLNALAAFAVLFGTLLLPGRALAQLQLNLTGNHLSSAESGARFSSGLWGGGAALRYFVSPRFALGVNGRYFTRSQTYTLDGGAIVSIKAAIIATTGQAEYFFTTAALRLYVGVEAGLYRTSSTFDVVTPITNPRTDKLSTNDFSAAPKIGLQYALTPAFGLNVDAAYQFIFNSGYTNKNLLLGAGVFYTFGRR